jgi:predicted nucleic-acid-binding protein
MTIADTNYLIRLFTKTPANLAKQALANIEASQPDSIRLPDYVISEAVYVLEYHDELAYHRQQITEGLNLILAHPSWRNDRHLHMAALEIYHSQKLDYVDCLAVAELYLHRVTKVLTFDKQLQKYLTNTPS